MRWSDFYENYTEWADSTVRSRISSWEDIGTGAEVAEVAIDLFEDKLKAQLIRKAIRLKAHFTHDDFVELYGELPDEVYQELAVYAGFDAEDPFLDEDNLTWDVFYTEYYNWNEADTLRRIEKLKNLGPSDEVCEAIIDMPAPKCEKALYRKALSAGVRFTHEELEEMGRPITAQNSVPQSVANANITQFEKDVDFLYHHFVQTEDKERLVPQKKGLGFWGTLLGLLSALAPQKKEAHGKCSGDCANCPSHYGYRYGRWYYGHGHRYGCEFGGNGKGNG